MNLKRLRFFCCFLFPQEIFCFRPVEASEMDEVRDIEEVTQPEEVSSDLEKIKKAN